MSAQAPEEALKSADREMWLATLHAPEPVRPALVALFALDRVLAEVPASVSEPLVGAIRLAWWREALARLDSAPAPAEPHLAAAAALLLPAGISGVALAGLTERWEARLAEDVGEAELRTAEAEGAARLFTLAGHVLGGAPELPPELAAALGRCWAVGEALPAGRVPPPLRPLLGLAVMGVRDARDAAAGRARAPRGTAGRQLRMLRAIATGR